MDAAPDARLTCGFPDRTFTASALDTPTGAERQEGPLFDALRSAFGLFDFPGGVGRLGWFLVQQDESGALFLAHADSPPEWWYVLVEADGSGWKPGGVGGCNLNVQISAEFGPAYWALDPDYPAPDPSTTELHVLVWELACNGGGPTTGRTSAPVVEFAAGRVTITIGVRALEGEQTCQLGPGTPAIVTLPQPLGERTLFDGYAYPPVVPSPPF